MQDLKPDPQNDHRYRGVRISETFALILAGVFLAILVILFLLGLLH